MSSSSAHAPSHLHEDNCEDDASFYARKERLSCRVASAVVCLSENDRSALRALMREDACDCDDNDKNNDCDCKRDDADDERIGQRGKDVHVLYPPLRGDIRELAMTYDKRDDERRYVDDEHVGDDDHLGRQRYETGHVFGSLDRFLPTEARQAIDDLFGSSLSMSSPSLMTEGTTMRRRRIHPGRAFVTCVVRLSPEKSPHNYVALLRVLGGIDFLRRHRLVPLICGSRSVGEYADDVVGELRRMMITDDGDGTPWPCVVIDRHIGPTELAAIFARTAINVHVSLWGFDAKSRIHPVCSTDERMHSPRALTSIPHSTLLPYPPHHFVVLSSNRKKNCSPACMMRMG